MCEVGKLPQEAIVEAVLFAAGDPLPLETIAHILGTEKAATAEILQSLADKWAADPSKGVYLKNVNDTYTIATKPILSEILQTLFTPENMPPITPAAYEVLAIIAYNQPTTRAQIEAVRGVNSDGLIHRLLEHDLIEPRGFLDAPGRPQLFGTTDKFLSEFGLNSTEALPPMELLMYSSLQELTANLQKTEGAAKLKNQMSIDNLLE